jgi:hypothetical protein
MNGDLIANLDRHEVFAKLNAFCVTLADRRKRFSPRGICV